MNVMRWTGIAAALVLAGMLCVLDRGAAAEGDATWDRMVDKAVGYLKSTQADDGTWSRERSPGVTGIVLTGLLQSGKVGPNDPVAQKALRYIESLVNPEEGHIAGKDAKVQL